MKRFITIFKYEFLRQVKTKAFLITGLILVLGIAVGGFFLSNSINDLEGNIMGEVPGEIPDGEIDFDPELILVYTSDDLKGYIEQIEATGMYKIEYVESEEKLSEVVLEEDFTGLNVKGYDDIVKVVASTSISGDYGTLDTVLSTIYQNHLLAESGLPVEEILKIQSSVLNIETLNLGEDGVIGFGFVYIYNMFLYMTVVMFGGIVSSSVISEKTSKAMELLITSAKASELVAGKVFAIGLSCIGLLVAVLLSGFISIKVFMSPTALSFALSMIGDVPYDVLLLALFLFVTGFFSILFLFAGFSSFATKPEDANVVITPLMIIIIIIFMVNMSVMGSDLLNSPVMMVLSYVPIFSPFFLFTQYVMYGLTTWQLVLGVITNILGAALLIVLAAKIYRAGTLHYGNTIKLSKMFKSIRSK